VNRGGPPLGLNAEGARTVFEKGHQNQTDEDGGRARSNDKLGASVQTANRGASRLQNIPPRMFQMGFRVTKLGPLGQGVNGICQCRAFSKWILWAVGR